MNATDNFLRLPSCELEIVAATTTTSAMCMVADKSEPVVV